MGVKICKYILGFLNKSYEYSHLINFVCLSIFDIMSYNPLIYYVNIHIYFQLFKSYKE
jgi:hypothetical protein